MAFQLSSDAIEIYRGVEEKIKDTRSLPIANGHIYFATDTDKVFYDADGIRHEIAGGGDISFIHTTKNPVYDAEQGYYVFDRTDIASAKLSIDNIILGLEEDNAIYRVLIIDDDAGKVLTKQIAGGGGSGGGSLGNPITIVVEDGQVPERIIDTQDLTFELRASSIITTDTRGMLQVFVNDVEVTILTTFNMPLRQNYPITIPSSYYDITKVNDIRIVVTVDENSNSKVVRFQPFHAEFAITDFDYRKPYGTDDSASGVSKQLNVTYTLSGLDYISGHIHMDIDGEELWDLTKTNNQDVLDAGGGNLNNIVNGHLNINCKRNEFRLIEHGSHTLVFRAYAVVQGVEYFINSYKYDIIWATEAGGTKPIIISAYPQNAEEENYTIINIPYLIYAKNQEKILTYLYINNVELPTSPINYENKGYSYWQQWTISKYTPNFTNTFTMIAVVGNQQTKKEFFVKITNSKLDLSPISDDLLLYLSANDRSNAESAVSRQTWTYKSASDDVTTAQFSGFNWYNDGWQYDDNGDNVLRLNNGATVSIPFDKVLQVAQPTKGFTIETEFRCRNATNFAKLLNYTALTKNATDEYGHFIWETEPVFENDEPVMQNVPARDEQGNIIPNQYVQTVDARGHLAFKVLTGYEEETNEPIYQTLYQHIDEGGEITYWTKKNKQYTGTIIEVEPIYEQEQVTVNKKLDPDGPDDESNWIHVVVEGGSVVKNINYVRNEHGELTNQVANAVGSFFGNNRGFCFGTQEAFFASKDVTMNVRYADNDKVKITVVADMDDQLLYIYINAVLSGVERFTTTDNFSTGASGFVFNSDYCDLDLYTIRVYGKPLDFAEVVQNWIGDAPNLAEKRKRYQENHITTKRYGYTTLDYELTKKLSKEMGENYRKQIALGVDSNDVQKGLPICVISTYPSSLTQDKMSDLLPYNKSIKQYVDIRFWDPNYDPDDPLPLTIPGFKCQDFELSVQGTSSQGYPRRNYKAKFKATDATKNGYANRYPFYWTTWDGDDSKKDIWPTFEYPETLPSTATEEEQAAYEVAYEAADKAGWDAYKANTTTYDSEGNKLGGYKKMKSIDIGNGTAEKNFCFKADYMDSSSAHNTSLANYVDFLCKNNSSLTYPMKKVVSNAPDWRSTIYGTPMLVFWDHKRQNTSPEFVGRYNFNTDKSATSSFGFTVDEAHHYLHDVDYYKWVKEINSKGEEEKVLRKVNGTPTYEEACECWELTSNQHGFTGFRRNDFGATDKSGRLDFYNFFENRYHIADFDVDDVYADADNVSEANILLSDYAKNIIDLSRWIYSTDVHPWDNEPAWDGEVDGEGYAEHQAWAAQEIQHKLSEIGLESNIKYRIISETENEINIELLRDYYTKVGTTVTLVKPDQFKVTKTIVDDNPVYTMKVYTRQQDDTVLYEEEYRIAAGNLYEDEVNAVLENPVFYLTRDTVPAVSWVDDQGNELVQPRIKKVYYTSADPNSYITAAWYSKKPIKQANVYVDSNGVQHQLEDIVVGYETVIKNPSTNQEIELSHLYEEYTRDTKAYRLAKYRAEFSKHLNFAYCAFYFILTEFFLLYDSREKNMMIATWGPEQPIDLEHPEQGGQYIWYPIFYDMDTQLGINNSGVVYWDYDANAQEDGIFSGAGSVLWDNFYACFLEEIKVFYRNLRSNGFNFENCDLYYNVESANRWTPIMKDIDAFYKYVAPSIDDPGLGYVTKQGNKGITAEFFYCAQGDRTLNRSAFFRNRFNYKDSEWLGGSYQTQGDACIEMRYDANWTGTSDPNASDFEFPSAYNTWTDAQKKAYRDALEANASFDIKPYLTQYVSVYYDELPAEGGRYDIQFEPTIDPDTGEPTGITRLKYADNLANIKRTGYITVDPLASIQQTIDSGLPLSQQLVYIYGPEYIRDLGDLSLKYLDRFFCGVAKRLNRLVLGNDNPDYKNEGMKGDFAMDTGYYSTKSNPDGTKKLNPNAKALLEYLDLSNLSGLSGALDISGCLKLNTVKLLGTNYTGVSFPEGNVIETAYLPDSTQAFVQIQAQKLNQVIRNADLANAYKQAKLNQQPAVGLFINKITDRMNISRDSGLFNDYAVMPIPAPDSQGNKTTSAINSYITSDPNYSNVSADLSDYATNLETYHIEGGNLGFISYEILDYVVKQKIKSRYDTTTNDKTQLDIRLLDVAWTPYELIDAMSTDDRTDSYNPYYIRKDDLTYESLPRTIDFAYANKNLGGVYKLTDKTLSMDGGAGVIPSKQGLPNLDLLKLFITEYNNSTRTNDTTNKTYLFRDTYNPNTQKYLPHIGGEIFIDNSDVNDPALDEYELYTIAQTYSAVLDREDTLLTICAAKVNACARAKFIEVTAGPELDDTSDGYMPDGDLKVLVTYRSDDASAVVPLPNDPMRNTYDFRGWATEEAVLEYAPEFLTIQDGRIVGNTGGIVSTESPLLEHLAVKVTDIETGEKEYAGGANALTFGEDQVNYYAIFTLHKYKVKYVLDTSIYNANNEDPAGYELVLVPSGAIIQMYPPQHIPYVKNDTLPLGQMHEFIGWNSDVTLAREQQVEKLDYAIREDMAFFPVYQVVTNARNKPLKEDYLLWTTVNNIETHEPEVIIYGTTRKLGGRICIPSHIDDMPVKKIIGASWKANRPTGWLTPTAVIPGEDAEVEGTLTVPLGGNGFQDNDEIEHIYFQGYSDRTCEIESFETGAFGRMINLVHIDIPDSLRRIGSEVFSYCSSLSLTSLNNVTSIGSTAFRAANTMVEDPIGSNAMTSPFMSYHAVELQITGGDLSIETGAFNNCGWQKLVFGRPGAGVTSRFSQANAIIHSGNGTVTSDITGTNASLGSRGLEEIEIYSAVETINDLNGVTISRSNTVEVKVYEA